MSQTALLARLKRLEAQNTPAEPLLVRCRSFLGQIDHPVRIAGTPTSPGAGEWLRGPGESVAAFRARAVEGALAWARASACKVVVLQEENAQ